LFAIDYEYSSCYPPMLAVLPFSTSGDLTVYLLFSLDGGA